jgi:threonyl-tRNA synthetase
MNQKIRLAQLEKVPYMLVVGDREAEAGALSLRLRSGEDRGQLPVEDFISLTRQAIATHE